MMPTRAGSPPPAARSQALPASSPRSPTSEPANSISCWAPSRPYRADVSEKKAKQSRRALRERPIPIVNADYARRSADAVLSVDLSEVPLTRVTQFIVGWFRSAFDQSRVIADLVSRGMASSGGPNRRLFAELAIRLHWLNDLAPADRQGAVDAMLDWERTNTEKTFKHLREMGWEDDVDLTEMKDFILDVTVDNKIRDQATKFAAAAHATEVKNTGLFHVWRDESSYAHATGYLASSHAPAGYDQLGRGAPPVVAADLEAHRLVQLFIVTMTCRLLVEEGADRSVATNVMDAFFSVP